MVTPRVPSSPLWTATTTRTRPAWLWGKFERWRELDGEVNQLAGVRVDGDPEPGEPLGPRSLPATYFTGKRPTIGRAQTVVLSRTKRSIANVSEGDRLRAIELRSEGMTFDEIGRTVAGISSRQARTLFDGHQTDRILPEEDGGGE